jgi:hypothetical protein
MPFKYISVPPQIPLAKPPFPKLTNHPLAKGLYLAYMFCEGTGSQINDLSPNRMNATFSLGAGGSGSPQWINPAFPTQSVRFGPGLNLKGITNKQYLDCGNLVNLPLECTILTWMYSNNNTGQFIGGGDSGGHASQAVLYVNNDSTFHANWNGPGSFDFGSVATISANNWFHYGFTRSGIPGAWTCTLYLNGKIDGSTTTIHDPGAIQGHFTINRQGDFDGDYSDSLFDAVMVWNRALSPVEVTQVYNDAWAPFRQPLSSVPIVSKSSAAPIVTATGDTFSSSNFILKKRVLMP